jgi:hypothetical protein
MPPGLDAGSGVQQRRYQARIKILTSGEACCRCHESGVARQDIALQIDDAFAEGDRGQERKQSTVRGGSLQIEELDSRLLEQSVNKWSLRGCDEYRRIEGAVRQPLNGPRCPGLD